MYNVDIADKNLWEASKQFNRELVRYDKSSHEEILAGIEGAVLEYDDDGLVKVMARDYTKLESDFIENERLVCKFDFQYFFNRYIFTQIKIPGKPVTVARITEPLESQKIFMEVISNKEWEIHRALAANQPTDGILLCAAKARQEGFTTVSRAITMHRALFWEDSKAMAISVDEPMVQELYDRDKTIYENLPHWMKPVIGYDTKAGHLTFKNMKSSITYAQGNQKGGLGTGKTVPVAHITELGVWEMQGANPEKLLFDLDPGIPQAPNTIVILESTANGRLNYWYQHVYASLAGKTRYGVVFCPWYLEPRYNRDPVPEGWVPQEHTKAMMETVERTSPSYALGRTIRLEPEQAVWWENQYEKFRVVGRLSYFLTNYPTTLDESFQVSGNRAFSPEVIAELRKGIKGGIPYEFRNTQPVGRIGAAA